MNPPFLPLPTRAAKSCSLNTTRSRNPCKNEVTHKEILLPPHAPPEFADRNTLWNSLWHNKSPHLFFSMPYCLTNGVQFRRAAPYGVWGRLATNKQGRIGYAGSLLAATTDTWIVIVPCFELDRINSRRYLSFFAQINQSKLC